MLRELHITNLAVIDRATIELHEGLNCFTGQTGAGKSLIIGAFECLLGMRTAKDMLRSGAREARVSGVFELRDPWTVDEVAATINEELSVGDELLITRRLILSGRSTVSINGQPATSSMVRDVGRLLVDVHGQHDSQHLIKPANQLQVIDAFGGSLELSARFAAAHEQWRRCRAQRDQLAAERSLRLKQQDLYSFQAEQIDACEPQAGEWAELQARHAVLSNLERLKRQSSQVRSALYDQDGSVVERLAAMGQVMSDLEELDNELQPINKEIRSATLTLQETAFELSRYADRLDLEPGELGQVNERLDVLNQIIDRYGDGQGGDDPLLSVLETRRQIQSELDRLRQENEDLEHIDERLASLSERFQSIGEELTRARRKAAARLRPLVNEHLRELGMAEADFHVEFEKASPDDQAADSGDFDRIEMMVRTNVGHPARPLRRIASGGELSRIMLAIKSVLARSDRISVLVFDEIDSNVGGRMGTVIGQKLRLLSAAADQASDGCHQVLCITHLPQIAAFADRHIRISKSVVGKAPARQTRAGVSVLSGKERIDELAQMLAGKDASTTTRRQAREMVKRAQGGKREAGAVGVH